MTSNVLTETMRVTTWAVMKLARKIDESASDVVWLRNGNPMSRQHCSVGGATDSAHRQSSGHSCCAWKMVTRSRYVFPKMVISILPRGLYVPEACDARMELIPWMNRPSWWMKHVPNGREESKTARDLDPRTHEETATVGTPGPMKQEHSQQQADK